MSTSPSKKRPWQFSLIWLFGAMFAVAFLALLWIADPSGWSIVTGWTLSQILPAGAVAGAVYCRARWRAFFTGMAVTQVTFAVATANDTPLVFNINWEQITDPLALNTSSVFPTADGMAKRTVIMIGVSVLSGLLAMTMRWLAEYKGSSAKQSGNRICGE